MLRIILALCLVGQAFAACEGPTLEDIQFTEKEYKMLQQVQEEEAILSNLGTLMRWSPLITLAGSNFIDTFISISTANWDELQTANKSLLKLRLRTAENVLLFIFRENPKNRQFWQALADYYQCATR